MEIIIKFWHNLAKQFFLNNSLQQWVLALAVLIGLILLFKFIFWYLLHRFQKLAAKTKTEIDDFALKVINGIKPPVYYWVAIYFASQFLTLPPKINHLIYLIFVVVIIWQAIFIALKITDYIVDLQIKKVGETEAGQKTILRFLKQVINGLIWVIGALMVLSNLGINVSSLIAGLGIGGLAIAMALKNILTDIFSSFSILIDKPFVVGDYIALNDKQQGTVKKIGIKTTRLETKDGQELIVANRKLTEQVIQNFRAGGKKKTRNISFTLGVTYETPPEKLKAIPQIIQDLVEKQEYATLKKVNFDSFGDFSLNFKIVISIEEDQGASSGEIKNQINYAILEAFQENGIDFAYPTQTIYLHQKTKG